MTPAVFGDFLDAARLHLAAATEAWDRDPAYLPAMVPPLHQMVTVMALYAEDLAGWDGIEAAARTGLDAWERPVIDLGALRIAVGCLHRSAAELGPGGPVSDDPPAARHLADAAAELAAGRDLLYTHVTSGPDGLTQDRSEWAPVVTSLPVARALAAEIAAWSARLAQFTGWLTGPATPQLSRRLARQFSAVSPQEEIISASQWLRAASTALRPASGTESGKAADAELLHAIPAAFPPPRQPPGAAAESIAGLCDGITVSAFRLRAAVHRGRNRGSQTPEFTSGGLQWMAQAAAITSQLSELALRSLSTRAGAAPRPAGHPSASAWRGRCPDRHARSLAAGGPEVGHAHHRTAAAAHFDDERGERSPAPDGQARLGQPAVDPGPRRPEPPKRPRRAGARNGGVHRRRVGRPSGG